jgi:hypothetical protein
MAAPKGNKLAVGNKGGRPFTYTEDVFFEILDRYSNGEDLIPLLKSSDRYPTYVTFNRWITGNDELLKLYTHARQGKTEPLIHKIHEAISDLKNSMLEPSAARVIIDTYKWEISKYYPKLYGDRVDVTTDGEKINQAAAINLAIDGKLVDLSLKK